jgi:hypothetical protein
MLVNLSETPDLTFVEIVHTGIEYRDNSRHPEYFDLKLSPLDSTLRHKGNSFCRQCPSNFNSDELKLSLAIAQRGLCDMINL